MKPTIPLKIRKALWESIKLGNLENVKNILSSLDFFNNQKDFFCTTILKKCVRSKQPEIFQYLLDVKGYLSHRDIEEFTKEPYCTILFDFISQKPDHPCIDSVYANLLIQTIRWNYSNKERIQSLLQNPLLDFQNKIQDPIYLYYFIYYLIRRRRNKTCAHYNNVVDILKPYVESNKINRELLVSYLAENTKNRKLLMNKDNKKLFENMDLEYKIKLIDFYKMKDPLYYWKEKEEEEDVEYTYKYPMDEISLGSYLLLMNKNSWDYNGKKVDYILCDEDKKKIDVYCDRFQVKNIGESNDDYFARCFGSEEESSDYDTEEDEQDKE